MKKYRVIYDPTHFPCDATECNSPDSSHTLRTPLSDVIGHACPTHVWLLDDNAKRMNQKEGIS